VRATERVSVAVPAIVLALASAIDASAGPVRTERVATVEVRSIRVPDLIQPEGRTRWDLAGLRSHALATRTISLEAGTVTVRDAAGAVVERAFSPSGGSDAERWMLPERDRAALAPGSREDLAVTVERSGVRRSLHIAVETVGIGWVHLPGGPREVVLQRARVSASDDGRSFVPDSVVHRWVDPRAGVVATVSGPASADFRNRSGIAEASFLDATIVGAADLVLYVDEIDVPSFTSVLYGWDIDNPESPGSRALVRHLTPEQYATIGDLIAADTWDFSQNTAGTEIASTVVALVGDETCNRDDADPNQTFCGYAGSGRQLGRQDIDFAGSDPLKNNQVIEREDRATDVTMWLRAGAQNEGRTGLFGGGESRFCYDEGRTQVPLWRFAHQDGNGWFMQPGDFWEPQWADPINTPFFDCEQTLFNQICGVDPGPLQPDILYAKPCNGHTGTQTGEVLKGGVVTLPSGHTMNALLVRTVGDFCVYSADTCRDGLFGNKLDEARTVVYLWQVPTIGTVTLLQSVQNAADLTSWSQLDLTDIRFGLFPPVAITAGGSTDTTLDVSWDPGNDVHRLDGYRVYWDTDSGAASSYANSVDVPGAASTSTTLTGLDPGTTYYITVTSLSTFANPTRPTNPTTYESLIFPTQVSGDPSAVYPVEVQATTTGGSCVPTDPVSGVTVAKAAPGSIQVCWLPTADPCALGYRVLGAASPASDTNFTPIADVGLETCWTGATGANGYFLVVLRGPGGEGPWGHFDR